MHCPVAVDNHSLELSHPNMASLEVQEISAILEAHEQLALGLH